MRDMATKTFTVNGHKVRSSSNRRYIVIIAGPSRAWVHKRSDSRATAVAHARRYGPVNHYANGEIWFATVFDSATDEEIAV